MSPTSMFVICTVFLLIHAVSITDSKIVSAKRVCIDHPYVVTAGRYQTELWKVVSTGRQLTLIHVAELPESSNFNACFLFRVDHTRNQFMITDDAGGSVRILDVPTLSLVRDIKVKDWFDDTFTCTDERLLLTAGCTGESDDDDEGFLLAVIRLDNLKCVYTVGLSGALADVVEGQRPTLNPVFVGPNDEVVGFTSRYSDTRAKGTLLLWKPGNDLPCHSVEFHTTMVNERYIAFAASAPLHGNNSGFLLAYNDYPFDNDICKGFVKAINFPDLTVRWSTEVAAEWKGAINKVYHVSAKGVVVVIGHSAYIAVLDAATGALIRKERSDHSSGDGILTQDEDEPYFVLLSNSGKHISVISVQAFIERGLTKKDMLIQSVRQQKPGTIIAAGKKCAIYVEDGDQPEGFMKLISW